MASTDVRIPDIPALKGMTLVRWVIPDGGTVRVGDELFEIETTKAVLSVESPVSGRLEQIALPGRPVLRGQLIGRIHPPDAAPGGV
jgi:pyruvate/2-oxoglutarate dehydrogenase complex dihydrolipoamide acyltransferase (E2) component